MHIRRVRRAFGRCPAVAMFLRCLLLAMGAAAQGRSGPVVVTLSALPGLSSNADFVRGTGADDRAVVQDAIDAAAYDRRDGRYDRPSRIVFDCSFAVRGSLIYHSNSEWKFVHGARVLWLPGSGDRRVLDRATGRQILCSALVVNDAPPQVTYPAGVPTYRVSYGNSHVTLEGASFDFNRAGNAAGSPGPAPPSGQREADASGVDVFGLCAYGVRDLVLRHCLVRHSPCYAYHLATVRRVVVDDCRVECDTDARGRPVYNSNQDGLHVNGPAQGLTVTHFTGRTGDDFIALNADDGQEGPDAAHPLYARWNNSVWHGDITDVRIAHCRMEGCLFGYRLLAVNHRIDRVTIRDTQGGAYKMPFQCDLFPGIRQSDPAGAAWGVGRVLVDGFTLDCPPWDAGLPYADGAVPPTLGGRVGAEPPADDPDACDQMFRLGGRIADLTLRHVRRARPRPDRVLVHVNGARGRTVIGRLTLEDVDVTGGAEARPLVYVSGGAVRRVTVRGLTLRGPPGARPPPFLVRNTGGALGLFDAGGSPVKVRRPP